MGHEVLRHLVKHYSGCVCECFWVRSKFDSVDRVKQIALPKVGGPPQSVEGLNRTERTLKREFLLPDCFQTGALGFFLPLDSN